MTEVATVPDVTPTYTLLHTHTTEDGVFVVTLDRPDSKVNLIDEQWLSEMTRVLDDLERNRPKAFVLASAKRGNFIAGADVSLIAALSDSREAVAKAQQGQELLNRIEDLPFPTVAVINGSCLGGGMETALAFRHRVAANDDSVTMGLPEVRLGILPGFGGTVRMPRTIGLVQAMPLLLTGKNVRPRKALKLGLVDRIAAPEVLMQAALETAKRPPKKKTRPLRDRAIDFVLGRTPPGQAFLRNMSRKNVQKETRGHYPAPFEIIERAISGLSMSREKALRFEAEAFGRLAVTSVAKNLLFLFQGNEGLSRHAWTGRVAEVDRSHRAAVIGAGTMGGGIAGALAGRGLDVRMKDVAVESLRLGMAGAAAPLNRRVKKRALKPRDRDAILGRIGPTLENTGLARANVVIEAVPENLELKINVLRELEGLVADDALLATNTSSIPVTNIAAGLTRPERFIGIHFFNPVDRMPLVEIIPGAQTSPDAIDRAVGLVRRLKKSPIVVADAPGFLVNRVLLPYLNEAALAVEDGWPIDRIDEAMLQFGMPMGPLRVMDEVGLDVAGKVAGVLHEAFGERATAATVLERLLTAGALGTKAGRGFWKGSRKDRAPNTTDVGATGSSPVPPDSEIVIRLMSGMVNEAARCLAEGVVSEPDHLDLGTVLGCGFPPFRGGVRRYALTVGEDEVRRRLDRLTTTFGTRFEPAESLSELFRG